MITDRRTFITKITPLLFAGLCHNFHPNRFTSGGVIAKRVNTVETRHKQHAAFASDFRIRARSSAPEL